MSEAERESLRVAISDRVRAVLDSGEPNPIVSPSDYRPPLVGSSMQVAFNPRCIRRGIFLADKDYHGFYLD